MLSIAAFGQSDPLRDLMLASDLGKARPSKPLCTVPIAQSPLVSGSLRLGMDAPRALLLADGPVVPSRTVEGVAIEPTYLDGKLVRLKAVYQDGVVWDGDAEFAYVIATEFKLPVAAWRSLEFGGLAMFCDGWRIVAQSNRIELTDERALDRKTAAAVESAEKKKAAFKP